MMQLIASGYDQVDIEAATERGILVCNALQLPAPWVAEHAFAMILDLAKNITQYEAVKGGEW